jgi:SNF2 family DNA or RNA helicase
MKEGKTKFAMKRLSVLLKAVMLRRTKDATVGEYPDLRRDDLALTISDGAPILKLPGRTVNLVECEFDASERAFYEEVEQRMSDKLDKAGPSLISFHEHQLTDCSAAKNGGCQQLYFGTHITSSSTARSVPVVML